MTFVSPALNHICLLREFTDTIYQQKRGVMQNKTGTKEKSHLHKKSEIFYCRLPVVKNA